MHAANDTPSQRPPANGAPTATGGPLRAAPQDARCRRRARRAVTLIAFVLALSAVTPACLAPFALAREIPGAAHIPGTAAPPGVAELPPRPHPAWTPAPPRRHVPARGIYLTGWTAGQKPELLRLLALVDRTELNAVVIDIKDCSGRTTYPTQVAAAQRAGAPRDDIADLGAVVRELHRRRIYAIARLVVFQDPVLARAQPELAVQTPWGAQWREASGLMWVDPYSREVWDYNVAIALEAARAGFDEVQFDYVRFPSDGNTKTCVYPHEDGRARREVIAGFLAYAGERLHEANVYVSADIFGLVPSAEDDLGIGQYYELTAAAVDFVSPMAYPSHYALRSFGLPDPDAAPGPTVYRTTSDALRRRDAAGAPAAVRPWLQDFSLRNPYGPREVRAQIDAAESLGVREWLLWNASNRYTEAALKPGRREWGCPQPLEN